MKDSTRIILIVICIALIVLLISVLVWGIVFKENFFEKELNVVKEEEIAARNVKEIIVSSPRADIQVFRTNEEEIKIVEKATRKVKEKDLFKVTTNENIGTLEIRDQRKSLCFGFCFLPTIVYEIYIPNSYQNQISITTTSGDIEINANEEQYQKIKLVSVSGDIKLMGKISANSINLKTTSGDIKLDYLNSASIEMNSISGDIEGNTLVAEETKMKTTSGDIELGWINGEVEVTSISGEVELDYFNPSGSSNFKTTSGDIEIILDKNASVRMQGHSISGDIRFPRSESILGEGENSISFETISGDVKVRVANEK